jgi:hypothetical protein
VKHAIVVLCVGCGLAVAQPPDELYQQGLAQAREKRWAEARAAFEAGLRATQSEARFHVQLAGIAFTLNDFPVARRHLRAALRLEPDSEYANDFLATIYALDENLDAALKYWNRAGKPELAALRLPAGLRTRPEVLDSAFAFAPLGLLRREEYLGTRARLDRLGVISRYRFEVTPQAAGEKFEVDFIAAERNGWGPPGWPRYLLPLQGVFFQAVMPEYANWSGRGVNVRWLARWDGNKQRLAAEISGPVGGDAAMRQTAYVDYRRERWDLTRSYRGGGTAPTDLELRKFAAGYGFRQLVSHRLAWWSEIELSWRGLPGGAPEEDEFAGGVAPVVRAGLEAELLNLPERRFRIEGGVSADAGKVMGSGLGALVKTQAYVRQGWNPRARGEDYAMRSVLRAGRSGGGLPFDEFHALGIERDTGLWMRGRAGTERGRKGSAPLGRDYVLATWEMDKVVYRGALWTVTAGPLVDTGRVWDGRGVFGAPLWMTDAGVQARIGVLAGPEVTLSWGRDLRGGGSVFYATLGRGPLLARQVR